MTVEQITVDTRHSTIGADVAVTRGLEVHPLRMVKGDYLRTAEPFNVDVIGGLAVFNVDTTLPGQVIKFVELWPTGTTRWCQVTDSRPYHLLVDVDRRTLDPVGPQPSPAWVAYVEGLMESYDTAAELVGNADQAVTDAVAAAVRAEAAAIEAELSAGGIGSAVEDAIAAAAEAAAAALGAQESSATSATQAGVATSAAGAAGGSATAAAGSAGAAAGSATTAMTAAGTATGAATNANTARNLAEDAANDAHQDAIAAAGSATSANTARVGAETARTGSETARTESQTARTDAQTARTGAETAQSAAAGSATAAAGSATAAADSAAAVANYYPSIPQFTAPYRAAAGNGPPTVGVSISPTASPSSLMQRNTAGQAVAVAPTDPTHLTPKQSVLDALLASNNNGTRTNLATNPSFETVVGGTALPGTGGVAALTRATVGGAKFGTSYLRSLWSTSSTAAGGNLAGGGLSGISGVFNTTPGATYSMSAWVRPSKTISLMLRFDPTGFAAVNGPAVSCPANTWTRLTVTTIAGGTTANSNVLVAAGVAAPTWSAGDTLDVDGICVELGDTPGEYFDGASQNAYWTGTAHQSSSVGVFDAVTVESLAAAVAGVLAQAWPLSMVTAKGDLISGSAAGALSRLPSTSVTDGAFLMKNAGGAGGMLWSTYPFLSGTGSPEGSRVAPPGTRYVDTNNTFGVPEWVKRTGTGNTGWTPVVGDTGWRSVSIDAGSSGTATNVLIRRSGDLVMMEIIGFACPDGSPSQPIHTPVAGFRSRGGTAVYQPFRASGTTNLINIYMAGGGSVSFSGTWASANGSLNARVQWLTSDAWPTSLPGSAA